MSTLEDDDGLRAICRMLRNDGTIEILCTLLEHGTVSVATDALLVLGNLVLDSVDAEGAAETKQRIQDCGGFEKLLSHL